MSWKRIGTGLAWVVGLAAFYAVLLGTQTLDAIDKELPRREAICAQQTELVIAHELRAETSKRYPGKTTLHELGHMLDHALGDPSEREPYTSIHAQVRDRGDLALRLAAPPQEHFAESFARYYFSDRTRRRLEEQDARTWEYFRDLSTK